MNLIPPSAAVEVEASRPTLDAIRAHVLRFDVTDETSLGTATEMVRQARETRALFEGKRLTIATPLTEAKRACDDLFRGPIRACDEIMSVLRRKIGDYALASRAAAADAMVRSAEALAVGEVPTEIVPAPPEAGGLSVREAWDFEVTDPTLVPDYLKSPDPAKIRRVIDGSGENVGAIPGVRIFKKALVVVR